MAFANRSVRQLKSGGDFTQTQSVYEMVEDQAVGRIEPPVQGRENIIGTHPCENDFVRIDHKFAWAIGLVAIVRCRIGQANSAFAMFQGVNATALADEVEQIKLATFQIPTWSLSGSPAAEPPQVNQRLLQQVFLMTRIAGDLGHHPAQGGVDFLRSKKHRRRHSQKGSLPSESRWLSVVGTFIFPFSHGPMRG